ncbi:MAG: small ribosomal subunit Rsm22 family protein [Xanthobacteraceae bacterium]|nr:small ribosomal subunit Rsm22 family protein [Xanthobacteraceae bacterium]
MISPDLPPALRAALEHCTHGLPRGDIAARADAISRTYRDGGNSTTIRGDADALAYALARMPATYAAVAACLNALTRACVNFNPESLLDVGAGPGTATWAALAACPSLRALTLLDANAALRRLALALAGEWPGATLDYRQADARAAVATMPPADLVIASYMIGELAEQARETFAAELWRKTRDTLLVVEPGTPAGYARILALRAKLIGQGAHVVAPCPHDAACPLNAPDWCHFAQRLARSRAHRQVKGAALPFEDEKFSYVVLTREAAGPRPARILAPPLLTKADMRLKLCRPDGDAGIAVIPRRDKAAYAGVRRLGWGDAVVLD